MAIVIIGVLVLPTLSACGLALPDSYAPLEDSGWTKTYGGTDDDFALDVIQTDDGGYALAGDTTSYTYEDTGLADVYLVKTDASGNMLWNKTYGGINDEGADCIIQTSDGGYVMAGYTSSFGPEDDDTYMIKTNSSGSIEWSKMYGGGGLDFATSVVQAGDGGYAIVGYSNSFNTRGDNDIYFFKTSPLGIMQWSKIYGGTRGEEAWSLVLTTDGGYAIAGYTSSYGVRGSDAWLVKTDSLGNIQWNRTYGGTYYESATSVVQTSDGGYALAGNTEYYGVGPSDAWLIKTDGSGNTQWSKTYESEHEENADTVIQTSDGGYALTGRTIYSYGNSDAWLVKTDGSGNMEWRKKFRGAKDDRTRSVIETSDGWYALAGWTSSTGNGGYDVYFVKTDSSHVHDVAVTDIHSSKTVVGQSCTCSLNITVENQGDCIETFNVTAWALITPPATGIQDASIVDLFPEEKRTVTVVWVTTGWPCGTYALGATATTIPDETDTTDNTLSGNSITLTIQGDVDGDFNVDIFDVVQITSCYGKERGDLAYNPNADVNDNGDIDIFDVVDCTGRYGQEHT